LKVKCADAVRANDDGDDRLRALQTELRKEQAKSAGSEGDGDGGEMANGGSAVAEMGPEFPFAFKHFRFMLYGDKTNDRIPDDLCPLHEFFYLQGGKELAYDVNHLRLSAGWRRIMEAGPAARWRSFSRRSWTEACRASGGSSNSTIGSWTLWTRRTSPSTR
jgi:hypothetical protein